MPKRSRKDERRMYGDLAWTWPVISPPEEYAEEAEQFHRAIRENSRIEAKTLLDLGCGAGHNDYTLKEHFDVTGVDLSAQMLELARQLNPEVTYHLGDMRSVRLDKEFDAVMIADSIDYMLTGEDLRAAFETAFTHLKPGGVFCTYAEVTSERFEQNRTRCMTGAQDGIEIALVQNDYDPDPTDMTYEMTFIYLVRRRGELQIELDHHLGGIFPLEHWPRTLKEVGFEVRRIESEWEDPMFICLKP